MRASMSIPTYFDRVAMAGQPDRVITELQDDLAPDVAVIGQKEGRPDLPEAARRPKSLKPGARSRIARPVRSSSETAVTVVKEEVEEEAQPSSKTAAEEEPQWWESEWWGADWEADWEVADWEVAWEGEEFGDDAALQVRLSELLSSSSTTAVPATHSSSSSTAAPEQRERSRSRNRPAVKQEAASPRAAISLNSSSTTQGVMQEPPPHLPAWTAFLQAMEEEDFGANEEVEPKRMPRQRRVKAEAKEEAKEETKEEEEVKAKMKEEAKEEEEEEEYDPFVEVPDPSTLRVPPEEAVYLSRDLWPTGHLYWRELGWHSPWQKMSPKERRKPSPSSKWWHSVAWASDALASAIKGKFKGKGEKAGGGKDKGGFGKGGFGKDTGGSGKDKGGFDEGGGGIYGKGGGANVAKGGFKQGGGGNDGKGRQV